MSKPIASLFVMGTASVGSKIPYKAFCQLADAACARGIDAFDTAPSYGRGLAQKYLQRYLAERGRTSSHLVSKVGRLPVLDVKTAGLLLARGELRHGLTLPLGRHSVQTDFSPLGIERATDYAVKALRRTHFNTLFIHAPERAVLQDSSTLQAIQRLRKHADAVGLAEPVGLDIGLLTAPNCPLDCVQVSAQTCFSHRELLRFKGELWVNSIVRYARANDEAFTTTCQRLLALRPTGVRLVIGFNHLALFDQLTQAGLLPSPKGLPCC